MLKKKKYYKYGQKRTKNKVWLPVLISASATIAFMATDYLIVYMQGETYMPQKEVANFCRELNLNTNYFSYQQDTPLEEANARAAFPGKKGIKINVYIDNLTKEEKDELQKVVNDLNEVFQVIRPANKFILDFSPSLLDRINKYNIDLFELEEKDKSASQNTDTVGDWRPNYIVHNKNGQTTYHSQIRLERGFISYQNFMHEIFHHLGFADAYSLSEDLLDAPTIMLNYNSNLNHLNKGDVALLAAKYGDYSTPEKKQALIDYINSYESEHEWYKEYEKQIDELIDKFVTDKNIDKSKLNFDLSGKTFIDNSVVLADSIMYQQYSFNNQKLNHDTFILSASPTSDKLAPILTLQKSTDYAENINGITMVEKSEPHIYFSVDDTLYHVYSKYALTVGKLVSPEEAQHFDELKRDCTDANEETLLQKMIDEIYPELGQYIPQTDRQISSPLKLHNATIFGDIIIDDKTITIGNNTYLYLKYKNGIYVPVSTSEVYFIFPDENNKYKYIDAKRLFGNYYIEKTLDVLEEAPSYLGQENEF